MSSSSRPTYEPFLDFDRFFDEAFNARIGRALSNPSENSSTTSRLHNLAFSAFKPRMDLHEDSQQNTVTVMLELPGVHKDDVEVQIENGRLTVTAENKLPTEFEEAGYAVREMRYGHFMRSLLLPRGVEAKDVKAVMDRGILRLTFPRSIAGQSQDSQRVPIS